MTAARSDRPSPSAFAVVSISARSVGNSRVRSSRDPVRNSQGVIRGRLAPGGVLPTRTIEGSRPPRHLKRDIGSSRPDGAVPTIVGCPLPEPYDGRVESIREELVAAFGVEEYPNPFPQFTLYALPEDIEVPPVVGAVERAVDDRSPVTVQTDGIGVFPQGVVWLPVAKSPELATLQSVVVRELGEPAPVPYYEPGRWFPHVGFAGTESDGQTGAIVEFLLEYDLNWEFTVEEITVTRPPAEGELYEQLATIDV